MTQDLTLEKEFNFFSYLHKQAICQGWLISYYSSIANQGVSLPEFMQESPKERAMKHLAQIIDSNMFNEFYEKCYQDVAELLP